MTIAGTTKSTDFPVTDGTKYHGAVCGRRIGGVATVSTLDMSRQSRLSLVWSTYLGGSGSDYAHAVALDASGNIYVAGDTRSTDFFGGTYAGGFNVTVVSVKPPRSSTPVVDVTCASRANR